MNEDTDPFGPARCKCCGVELVDADDDGAQGQRSYALLRFDDGQTYRESADKDWSLCSLNCVIQFATKLRDGKDTHPSAVASPHPDEVDRKEPIFGTHLRETARALKDLIGAVKERSRNR